MKRRNAIISAAVFLILAAMYHFLGCPIRLLTGVCCPGCGMTRAALCCCRLDFQGAFYCHPLIFTIPLFALAFYIFRKNKKAEYIVLTALCISLLGVYIYRMACGTSPDVVYFHPDQGVIYKFIRSVSSCLLQKCYLLPPA